jgi:hypothetical protein
MAMALADHCLEPHPPANSKCPNGVFASFDTFDRFMAFR